MKSPETGKDIKPPVTEMLKSVPEFFGIRLNEEPEFDLLYTVDGVEIRAYPQLTIATVSWSGDESNYEYQKEEAFKRLAAYIFGENNAHEKMAMTAPVILKDEPTSWSMSFILPKDVNVQNLPKPVDSSIAIKTVEPQKIAVLKYSGNNTQEDIDAHKKELAEWFYNHKKFALRGEILSAQYDAPFVISFLKKNEVFAEVEILETH